MDGVLNVNKPSGMTSHDVVQAVRRIIKEKRVGHTGTLDPLATGVLVLCVGKATRIARYLEAGVKEYQAVMKLSVTTDTLDADGRILETRTYSPPTEEQLSHALKSFFGEILQSPPAYSAVKVGGVPSYRLARQGKAAPLKARRVTISNIEITSYEDPFVSLTIRCSKGVYVRSLCADLGNLLGTGAHLVSLTRTRSGRFIIDSAIMLPQIDAAASAGTLDQVLISKDAALAEMREISLEEADSLKILHGNRIVLQQTAVDVDQRAELVRVHDGTGRLLAIARAADGELRPELVFS
jgi:tRNA pseudouridine55 synthase